MGYLLTIAIPTFNRGFFIERQLNAVLSILPKNCSEIEILVCDNASTDNTYRIVNKHARNNKNLTYFRQKSNIGLDGNVFTCYERAQGAFVWFLSDDDQLVPGAIKIVLDEIRLRTEASVIAFSFVEKNSTIPESKSKKCYKSFNSYGSVEDYFKVIMISTLVLKKIDLNINYLKTLTPSIFPQITLSLKILQIKFYLIASSRVIVLREPGYISKNFFELYCLNPRLAIKNASWASEEQKLLDFSSRSLSQFIKLELMERIGFYKSKSGLPWSSIKSAINEYLYSPYKIFLIIVIYFISLMPRPIARLIYLLNILFKTFSFTKALHAYKKLISHINENIDSGKISDV